MTMILRKRILSWCLAALAGLLLTGATTVVVVVQPAVTGPVLKDYSDDNSISVAVGNDSGSVYVGDNFTASAAYAVAYVDLYLGDNNTPTGTMTLSIYSDSSSEPGSIITNGTSGAINRNLSLSGGVYEWKRFTFSTPPSLSSSTVYWLVIANSTTDSSDYVFWRAASAGGAIESADASTWAVISNRQLTYRVYGQ